MQKVIMTRGLPASGKSTWARQFIKDNQGWKRINKDDLRSMIDDGMWSKENESMIVEARNTLLRTFLNGGFSVIIDDTNIQDIHIKKVFHLVSCEYPNVVFEVMDFDTDKKECLRRDKLREAKVGPVVINSMASQLAKVDKDAWRSLVETKISPRPSDEFADLPSAYIVDIDGTIAEMSERGPFDWEKVDTDLLNQNVSRVVNQLSSGAAIILLSGRSSAARERTIGWLRENGIVWDELYMREDGDMRPDYIIKHELFEKHIRNRYDVLGVFDDRDQVVHMWRKHYRLTVFQVNYGNF